MWGHMTITMSVPELPDLVWAAQKAPEKLNQGMHATMSAVAVLMEHGVEERTPGDLGTL